MPKGLDAIDDGWRIIEEALLEAGLTGPPRGETGIPFRNRAEQVSKAIVARLANNDPPVLLAYPDELKDEDT